MSFFQEISKYCIDYEYAMKDKFFNEIFEDEGIEGEIEGIIHNMVISDGDIKGLLETIPFEDSNYSDIEVSYNDSTEKIPRDYKIDIIEKNIEDDKKKAEENKDSDYQSKNNSYNYQNGGGFNLGELKKYMKDIYLKYFYYYLQNPEKQPDPPIPEPGDIPAQKNHENIRIEQAKKKAAADALNKWQKAKAKHIQKKAQSSQPTASAPRGAVSSEPTPPPPPEPAPPPPEPVPAPYKSEKIIGIVLLGDILGKGSFKTAYEAKFYEINTKNKKEYLNSLRNNGFMAFKHYLPVNATYKEIFSGIQNISMINVNDYYNLDKKYVDIDHKKPGNKKYVVLRVDKNAASNNELLDEIVINKKISQIKYNNRKLAPSPIDVTNNSNEKKEYIDTGMYNFFLQERCDDICYGKYRDNKYCVLNVMNRNYNSSLRRNFYTKFSESLRILISNNWFTTDLKPDNACHSGKILNSIGNINPNEIMQFIDFGVNFFIKLEKIINPDQIGIGSYNRLRFDLFCYMLIQFIACDYLFSLHRRLIPISSWKVNIDALRGDFFYIINKLSVKYPNFFDSGPKVSAYAYYKAQCPSTNIYRYSNRFPYNFHTPRGMFTHYTRGSLQEFFTELGNIP